MKLLLLSRPGCHLCEQLLQELYAAFPEVSWRIEEADVDSRDNWRRRWGLKIPVLMDERGEPVCITRFDPKAVAELLRAASDLAPRDSR